MSTRMPPNIVRTIYGLVHPAVQQKIRRAAPVNVRNLPRPGRDYTKGTGRYQRWYNEAEKKLRNNGRAFGIPVLETLANMLKELKQAYPNGADAMRRVIRTNPYYWHTWSVLMGPLIPESRNAIMDRFLWWSKAAYIDYGKNNSSIVSRSTQAFRKRTKEARAQAARASQNNIRRRRNNRLARRTQRREAAAQEAAAAQIQRAFGQYRHAIPGSQWINQFKQKRKQRGHTVGGMRIANILSATKRARR